MDAWLGSIGIDCHLLQTLTAAEMRESKLSQAIAVKLLEFHQLDIPGTATVKLWDRLRSATTTVLLYGPSEIRTLFSWEGLIFCKPRTDIMEYGLFFMLYFPNFATRWGMCKVVLYKELFQFLAFNVNSESVFLK
jgi:hypothetical protein